MIASQHGSYIVYILQGRSVLGTVGVEDPTACHTPDGAAPLFQSLESLPGADFPVVTWNIVLCLIDHLEHITGLILHRCACPIQHAFQNSHSILFVLFTFRLSTIPSCRSQAQLRIIYPSDW